MVLALMQWNISTSVHLRCCQAMQHPQRMRRQVQNRPLFTWGQSQPLSFPQDSASFTVNNFLKFFIYHLWKQGKKTKWLQVHLLKSLLETHFDIQKETQHLLPTVSGPSSLDLQRGKCQDILPLNLIIFLKTCLMVTYKEYHPILLKKQEKGVKQ